MLILDLTDKVNRALDIYPVVKVIKIEVIWENIMNGDKIRK